MFATPNEDTIEVTRRALRQVEADQQAREMKRIEVALKYNYPMLGPGMF